MRLLKKESIRSQGFRGGGKRFSGSGVGYSPIRTVLQEDVPTIVDVEEFRYEYKCKHCGVQWCELRETTHSVDEPRG